MILLYNSYLLLAILVGRGTAQDALSAICAWTQLRAAAVRDAVYVNGGQLLTTVTVVGSTSTGFNGSIYALNFSTSFETQNDSFSALFVALPEQGPMADYWDGTIFATEEKMYLYGGLLPTSDSALATPSGHVLGYQIYSTESEPTTGPLNETLPISSYITNGAGVNVPSESLGYYFSGMEAPGGVQIEYDDTAADTASLAAESFLQVNMSSTQGTKWSNLTWPVRVKPRANAQLVWLPVSSQGVLIVIGGVVDPTELLDNVAYDSPTQTTESQLISPTFMTSLPIYDIGSQEWFVQSATGDVPGQLTEFCSVFAQADGSSSFEIYIFGGNDGLNGSSRGDVWILSIPSFIWVHAYDPGSDPTNNITHARDSHTCVKPYPDQMLAIGGRNTNTKQGCFNGIIDVFNLTTLMWLDQYDPRHWSEYSIPSVVASSISATPTATGMNSTLSAILGSKYNKSIPTYYPYPPPPGPNATSPSKLLPAVLGAVLGVVGLSSLIVAIWWFLRRKGRKSVTSGTQQGDRVGNWVMGKPDPSVTTTEVGDPGSPPLAGYYEVQGDWDYRGARPPQAGGVLVEAEVVPRPATSSRSVHAEADGAQRYEMHVLNQGLPRAAQAEADGTARYEMHALERGSTDVPAEMATSYHFRDHSLYPRNPTGASETMSPTHGARSTRSDEASAPSPYVPPRRSVGTEDRVLHPTFNSPPLSSPDQSPPLPSGLEHRPSQKQKLPSTNSGIAMTSSPRSSPGLDALEAVSGLGYSASRPSHQRNISSLSSGIAQLPSPLLQQVPADEDQRRSVLLSGLPPSPLPAPPLEPNAAESSMQDQTNAESQPLVCHQTLQQRPEFRNGRTVVTRKRLSGRSAFKEEGMDSTEGPRTR